MPIVFATRLAFEDRTTGTRDGYDETMQRTVLRNNGHYASQNPYSVYGCFIIYKRFVCTGDNLTAYTEVTHTVVTLIT